MIKMFNKKKKGLLSSEEYDIVVFRIFNNILKQFITYVKDKSLWLASPFASLEISFIYIGDYFLF